MVFSVFLYVFLLSPVYQIRDYKRYQHQQNVCAHFIQCLIVLLSSQFSLSHPDDAPFLFVSICFKHCHPLSYLFSFNSFALVLLNTILFCVLRRFYVFFSLIIYILPSSLSLFLAVCYPHFHSSEF